MLIAEHSAHGSNAVIMMMVVMMVMVRITRAYLQDRQIDGWMHGWMDRFDRVYRPICLLPVIVIAISSRRLQELVRPLAVHEGDS